MFYEEIWPADLEIAKYCVLRPDNCISSWCSRNDIDKSFFSGGVMDQ